VQLRINTAAALAAAKDPLALSQRFADYSHEDWPNKGYRDLKILGYPARFEQMGNVDYLEVLTPKVWIYLSSGFGIADESALSKLAALALPRVDSTKP
jgi:hypothetical protein